MSKYFFRKLFVELCGGELVENLNLLVNNDLLKNLLVESNEIPVVTIPEQYKEVFNFADRGGLSAPTEICFGIAAIASATQKLHQMKQNSNSYSPVPTIDLCFYVRCKE